MNWNKVPAGTINRANNMLWNAVGNNAEFVAERLSVGSRYSKWIAKQLLSPPPEVALDYFSPGKSSFVTMVVPDDYCFDRAISDFRNKHEKSYRTQVKRFFHPDFVDENFSKPTHQLKPGQLVKIEICTQEISKTTTEERLAYLKARNALLLGAQGLLFLLDQASEYLFFDGYSGMPELISIDEMETFSKMLLKMLFGKEISIPVIPRFHPGRDDGFEITYQSWDHLWPKDVGLVCITEIEEEES